jgi:hypothetical protein
MAGGSVDPAQPPPEQELISRKAAALTAMWLESRHDRDRR